MTQSKIEWCDRSDWNPLRGCTRVSSGCGGPGPHGGWTGKVELIEDRLTAPMRWRKPARIFAPSMSDLFHESVPDEWIDRIFAVMALCPQHTFQVLTKRAERMRDYLSGKDATGRIWEAAAASVENHDYYVWALAQQGGTWGGDQPWPCPNIHLGVSVEDQQRAEERIPPVLDTPAAVRWVSVEPMLSAIDLSFWTVPNNLIERPGLDWVVIGGESGPRARPFNIEWARSIIAQCKAAGVPVFMKQIGSRPQETFEDGSVLPHRTPDRNGGNPAEWPEDLRIRERPI